MSIPQPAASPHSEQPFYSQPSSAPSEPYLTSSSSDPQLEAAAEISGQTIHLEVAHTPQQQAQGLMGRNILAINQGMLFPFNPPQRVGFWMKNVPISLDIIFLRNGKVVEIAANLPSCTADPCPVYQPAAVIDQVIEIRGGRATELNLRVGDTIPVRFLPQLKT
ncbi:MAG TPA: DUF192 domain-containing protein [Candidatus Caenarcaniphilales bacterium]